MSNDQGIGDDYGKNAQMIAMACGGFYPPAQQSSTPPPLVLTQNPQIQYYGNNFGQYVNSQNFVQSYSPAFVPQSFANQTSIIHNYPTQPQQVITTQGFIGHGNSPNNFNNRSFLESPHIFGNGDNRNTESPIFNSKDKRKRTYDFSHSDEFDWTEYIEANLICCCCEKELWNCHRCKYQTKEDKKNKCKECHQYIRVKTFPLPICDECNKMNNLVAETLFGKHEVLNGMLYAYSNLSQFMIYALHNIEEEPKKKSIPRNISIDSINDSYNETTMQISNDGKDDETKLAKGYDVHKKQSAFCILCGHTTETNPRSYKDTHTYKTTNCPCCNNLSFITIKYWSITSETTEDFNIVIKRSINVLTELLDKNQGSLIPINDYEKSPVNGFNYQDYPKKWLQSNNSTKAIKLGCIGITQFLVQNKKDSSIIRIEDTQDLGKLTDFFGLPNSFTFDTRRAYIQQITSNNDLIERTSITPDGFYDPEINKGMKYIEHNNFCITPTHGSFNDLQSIPENKILKNDNSVRKSFDQNKGFVSFEKFTKLQNST